MFSLELRWNDRYTNLEFLGTATSVPKAVQIVSSDRAPAPSRPLPFRKRQQVAEGPLVGRYVHALVRFQSVDALHDCRGLVGGELLRHPRQEGGDSGTEV